MSNKPKSPRIGHGDDHKADMRAKQRSHSPGGPNDTLYLYGLHTIAAALNNQRRQKSALSATPNALKRLHEIVGEINLPVEICDPRHLDQMVGAGTVHQGLVLKAEPLPRLNLSEMVKTELLVVLDQITDPHNVGAILRSAAAFGADGVVTTARHAPDETGVMAKSASGALDMLPLVEVNNLGQALIELKKRAVFCIGLDSGADASLAGARIPANVALVLGAEGKGLRQKTRRLCDLMVRLDVPGPIMSLNVSNAAAISLYALSIRRGGEQS